MGHPLIRRRQRRQLQSEAPCVGRVAGSRTQPGAGQHGNGAPGPVQGVSGATSQGAWEGGACAESSPRQARVLVSWACGAEHSWIPRRQVHVQTVFSSLKLTSPSKCH